MNEMKDEELKRLLTNPKVFPVEITLTSGDKMKVEHPDYVHFSQKLGHIFLLERDGERVFEWIEAAHIARIRAKMTKGRAA